MVKTNKERAMNAPAILVVDDDERLRSLLSEYLSGQGFFVCTAQNAAQASDKLDWLAFDAMVLDRMMPGQDGLSFARSCSKQSATPILMLTAMGEPKDRIAGLEAGVQDYLAKPFEPRELVLRLNNLLNQSPEYNEVVFGPYRFDLSKRQLWQGEQFLHLTSAEMACLFLLAESQGQPVSRETLASGTGQPNSPARTADVQINRLRKKLEPDPARPVYIRTVRGEGYALSRS